MLANKLLWLTCLLPLVSRQTGTLAIIDRHDETDGSDLIVQPCNGYAAVRDLPLDHFAWLGARTTGECINNTPTPIQTCQWMTQDRNMTDMLYDGIRMFDLELCLDARSQYVACLKDAQGKTRTGSNLSDITNELLEFLRAQPYQVVVLHLSSRDAIDVRAIDTAIDKVCEVHADLTLGVDAFEHGKCPFIHVQNPRKPWPSLGEVAGYDPEMFQWEGDGEMVGVRSRLIVTASENILPQGGNYGNYLSKMFWQAPSAHDTTERIKKELHTLCQSAGAVGIQAYSDDGLNTADSQQDADEIFSPAWIEQILVAKDACNVNQSPETVWVNKISVDFYHHQLDTLRQLQKNLVEFNKATWQRQPRSLALLPTLIYSEPQAPYERDEL